MDKLLINEAVESLKLLDIFLYSSAVNRFEEIYKSDYPDDMSQQSQVSVKVDVLESDNDEGEEKKEFIHAKVNISVRFVQDNNDKIKPLCEIEACFVAKYLLSKEISEEAISEFSQYNVIHNIWPFWREHAFRMSREAELPLPMITLYNKHSNEEEE